MNEFFLQRPFHTPVTPTPNQRQAEQYEDTVKPVYIGHAFCPSREREMYAVEPVQKGHRFCFP